uniref:Putative cellulase n=1 Tax=Neocallimastix patriciarum TaxID=4758 RepID=H2BPU5_NEOPA|nr:putative cellulase [Neocallimastix patriciarum]
MTSNNPMSGFKYQGTCFNNPGDFFQTTGNNHHTIIEFKNKYYIFYHAEWLNKQILGGQKGYRTTHVDELPVNGDRLGNAKGTLSGVSQLGNVDGSALNYAASMAWQSGISVKGQGAVTQVNYGRGAWTGVSNVALGNAKSITLRASSSSGATVKICAGSENGTVLGYVDIPAGGSLQNVTGSLSGASGTKNLFFIASGNLTIESWQLDGESSNTNPGNTDEPVNEVPNTEHVPTTDVTDGWYYIKNTGSDKYLQATGSSAGSNVEISSFTGSSAQKWKVTANGEGYITLLNGNGDFNLDVDNAKNENGANILIYNAYGGVAQQFALTAGSNGSFIITTRVSDGGKAIDVYENRTNDGANVCQWAVNGNSNQTWVFERVDGGSSNGDKSNDKNDTCWAKALGYKCCSSCLPVYFTDDDGAWSIVNDDWCGLPTSCKDNSSTCKGAQGYPCCKSSCAVYSSDGDGDWSIENDDWCLINKKVC